MDSTKITREKDGCVESYMVDPKDGESNSKHKITRPRVGQCKNNSQKGRMGGELNAQDENNLPKNGESNGKHENNLPKG